MMGAIVKLDKMPERCNKCLFANEDITFCRLRNSKLIRGRYRKTRMPLCPLVNEGAYITNQIRAIKKVFNK